MEVWFQSMELIPANSATAFWQPSHCLWCLEWFPSPALCPSSPPHPVLSSTLLRYLISSPTRHQRFKTKGFKADKVFFWIVISDIKMLWIRLIPPAKLWRQWGERERKCTSVYFCAFMCVCVCVCVWKGKRKRWGEKQISWEVIYRTAQKPSSAINLQHVSILLEINLVNSYQVYLWCRWFKKKAHSPQRWPSRASGGEVATAPNTLGGRESRAAGLSQSGNKSNYPAPACD